MTVTSPRGPYDFLRQCRYDLLYLLPTQRRLVEIDVLQARARCLQASSQAPRAESEVRLENCGGGAPRHCSTVVMGAHALAEGGKILIWWLCQIFLGVHEVLSAAEVDLRLQARFLERASQD